MINKKSLFLSIIGLVFLILLMILVPSKTLTINDFYGSWEGRYSNNEVFMEFSNDGTWLLKINEIGSEITETIDGDFTLDFSKDFIPLSIRNIPQLDHPLHTIIKVLGVDSIIVGNFAPKWRVRGISFNNNQNITLTKKN